VLAPRAAWPSPEILPVTHLAFGIVVDRLFDRLQEDVAMLLPRTNQQLGRVAAKAAGLFKAARSRDVSVLASYQGERLFMGVIRRSAAAVRNIANPWGRNGGGATARRGRVQCGPTTSQPDPK
jgi:hypothetical protein